MTKTDFIREQTNIKMFTKLILQLKSDRSSFTVLVIGFSSDWDRTPTDFETIFLFDLCVHIIRFLPKAYRKEISDWKSYRVTAPVSTMVPQLLLQQPAILINHWTSSLIKRAHYFNSFCQKKTRDLKEVAN
jgi:hypothetical protein